MYLISGIIVQKNGYKKYIWVLLHTLMLCRSISILDASSNDAAFHIVRWERIMPSNQTLRDFGADDLVVFRLLARVDSAVLLVHFLPASHMPILVHLWNLQWITIAFDGKPFFQMRIWTGRWCSALIWMLLRRKREHKRDEEERWMFILWWDALRNMEAWIFVFLCYII